MAREQRLDPWVLGAPGSTAMGHGAPSWMMAWPMGCQGSGAMHRQGMRRAGDVTPVPAAHGIPKPHGIPPHPLRFHFYEASECLTPNIKRGLSAPVCHEFC